MRAYSRAIFTLLLGTALFVPQSVDAKSYRELRKKKGMSLKSKKRSYEIQEIKKMKVAPVEDTKKRGPMKLQAFERFNQERQRQITDEQIKSLIEIIETTPKDQRADLYFRLAEHYWESSKYYDFIGHRYDDFQGRPDWPEKKRLQTQAWARANEARKKAATEYFKIINNYPDYPRLCEAYFFLGKNLIEMNETQKGLGVYRPFLQKFARTYPKCPFIPNAYLAFAEYYFEKGQVKNAKQQYEMVLRFRDTSIYGFALYKVAWCDYNMIRYQDALNKFVAVINYARDAENFKGSNSRRLALLKEALRDMVLAYSQVGEAADAERRFREIGGEDSYLRMLQNLGGIYRSQGKTAAILTIYNTLMRLQPDDPITVKYQLYITRAVDADRSKTDTIREATKLGGLVKSFSQTKANDEQYKEAVSEVKTQLNEYARYRHYEAQKTLRQDFFDEAREFYKIYLDVFPKDDNAYEMRFWLAEIQYKSRQFKEAADNYILVYRSNPKGKYSFDASYNTILAYDLLMKRERINPENLTEKKGAQEKKPLPDIAKSFLDACEDHIKYYPKGDRALEVSYKAALLYYYFNHFDKALPQFYFLVEKHPKHEYAIFSAHFILDTYQLQQEWDKLNKSAWKFYKVPELGDRKFKGEMRNLIIGSGMKICESIVQQKQYTPAAECFLKIAREFPDNKNLGPTALFNASIHYGNAKEPERALNLRLEMLEKYPGSRFEKDTVLGLADLYASRADFSRAAAFYERYANKYSKDPKIDDIIIQAAIFREAMGDNAAAMAHYTRLMRTGITLIKKRKKSKDDKTFVAIYLKIAQHHKDNGEFSRYRNMMEEFAKQGYGSAGQRLHAKMEVARVYDRQRLVSKAKKEFELIPRRFNNLPDKDKENIDAIDAAANVRFMDAEKDFAEYRKIQLKAGISQDAMKKTLQQKLKALEKTSKKFEVVAKYKHPAWRIASYFRVGELFLDYSRFIGSAAAPDFRKEAEKNVMEKLIEVLKSRGVPWKFRRPLAKRFLRGPQGKQLMSNLLEKLKMQYEEGLLKQSAPYEAQAVTFYQRSLRVSHNASVYNEWTFKSLGRLQELRPKDYHKFIEERPSAGVADSGFRYSSTLMEQAPTPSEPPSKGKKVADDAALRTKEGGP